MPELLFFEVMADIATVLSRYTIPIMADSDAQSCLESRIDNT
jgi:hypothetical protein